MSCEHDETNPFDFLDRFWRNFPTTKMRESFAKNQEVLYLLIIAMMLLVEMVYYLMPCEIQ